jgi:hypothetical protein
MPSLGLVRFFLCIFTRLPSFLDPSAADRSDTRSSPLVGSGSKEGFHHAITRGTEGEKRLGVTAEIQACVMKRQPLDGKKLVTKQCDSRL